MFRNLYTCRYEISLILCILRNLFLSFADFLNKIWWILTNTYLLRNMVHLPFFLQNAGLRKVKVAQQLSAKQKSKFGWVNDPPPRKIC